MARLTYTFGWQAAEGAEAAPAALRVTPAKKEVGLLLLRQ